MSKICKAPGCERTDIKAKGYCHLHWQRLKRNGTLEPKILKNGPRSKYPEEYKALESARQRCYNKTNGGYKNYGGRGIKVCDRWLEKPYGFQNFMDDMGPKPSYARTPNGGKPIWTLDRIDPNGDYCPENCRWATWLTQESNKRNNSDVPGVRFSNGLWVARHRTSTVVIQASFKEKDLAIEAKKYWNKKYPL